MSNTSEISAEDLLNTPTSELPKDKEQSPASVSQEPLTTDTPGVSTQKVSTKVNNAKETIPTYSFKPDTSVFNYTFSLPSIAIKALNTKLSEFNNKLVDEKSQELKDWKKVTEESVEFYTPGGLYQERFQDSTSSFSQGVETKEGELSSISAFKFKKSEGEIKGEAALLKVSKLLGLGDIINIPLPHSGIWVTIKPPTEKDLIDFYNTIFREKIILGRATSGLTLTNFSVYINNRLFDFILKHIHSVNYGDMPKEELKNYLLIHDFPILAWGFACSMYPNGFDFQRACVNDIETCSHVAKALINMTKLLWVDNSSLTESQKQILSEFRPNKLTLDNYRKFIAEHSRVTSSTLVLKNDIKLKLKVPTFNEYATDGLAWVNKINTAIESVIIEEGSDEEAKTEILNQYVKASILRQFNHFVDYIEVDDNTVQDRDTINSILEAFSAEDDIRGEVTKGILQYKSDTTLALIGIPDYECPSCGFNQNKEPVNPKFVNVIPIDVMNVFYTLLTLKVARVMERQV